MQIPDSLPLEIVLPDRLDGAASRAVAVQLWQQRQARPIVMEASRVSTIDPVGVTLLAQTCRGYLADGRGSLELRGLNPLLRHQLRVHPLSAFLADDEALFLDPFDPPEPSDR